MGRNLRTVSKSSSVTVGTSTGRLDSRARQHELVAALGQLALSGAEVPELMEHAVQRLGTAMGVEYVRILALQPDGKTFLLRAALGWNKEYIGHEIVSADVGTPSGFTLVA